MPIGPINLEWLDHNSQRAFPLAADATQLDVSGAFRLPQDFVVSLYLPIHAGNDVEPGRFFIRTVAVYSTGFSIIVGYQPDVGDAVNVAAANIARVSHTTNQAYLLGGVGDFFDSRGVIVIGRLNGIDSQPSGQFQFTLDGGRLETDVIRPMIRGISSIRVVNNNEVSDPIYGDVVIRAGTNMTITPIIQSGQDPVLQFNAVEGAGLTESCVCGDETAPPIRTINGITPDQDGNFNLLGNPCLELEDIDHGQRLNDVCSQPCCGCTELEVVTDQLERLGQNATTLEAFITALEGQVTQMDLAVLGSRLGDRACNG